MSTAPSDRDPTRRRLHRRLDSRNPGAGREHPDDSETVDGDTFKAAMRTLAGGVVIVTTRVEDRPWGLTISSCTSLTLDPPQILISLRASATSSREIEARRVRRQRPVVPTA